MNPLKQHLNNLPSELANALQEEFQKLHQQYFLGRWEPSQLDGGRFAEAVFRIVEYKNTNSYTPISRQINRQNVVNSAEQNTNLEDSLRFQIPRLASLMLDFRNNRNVGHLGNIDVNGMDSTFMLNAANWIVAELIRLETQMGPDDAQAEITKIIERKVPIIEEIGGRLKVLDPSLDIYGRILVVCYKKFPDSISEDDLIEWTEYNHKHKSRFRGYLRKLDDDKLVDSKSGNAVLTSRGVVWIEENISFEIEI